MDKLVEILALQIQISEWDYRHHEQLNHYAEIKQIEKFEAHEYSPGTEEAIPPDDYKEYHFAPRPPTQMPPIKPEEFKCRFYACYRGGNKHHHFFPKCRRPCRDKQDALNRIPKRDRDVIEDGDNREIFWGLVAVEQISFFMVAMYHSVILAPCLTFWMIWLFAWHHPGDLQNASVPLLAVLPLLSLFWYPLVMGHR